MSKIKIDHVTGGKDKDDLKNCYFEPSTEFPNVYNFYSKTGTLLAQNLSVGESFQFDMDNVTWTILDWTCDGQNASGNWNNNAPDPAGEQAGTFTAQAGGGVEGETDEGGRILPLEQISINEVLEDGVVPLPDSPLLGCFFSPEGPLGEYMFFARDGQKRHSGVIDGVEIKVDIGGQTWHLTTHFHPHEEKAHGKWKTKKPGSGEEDQGGTFTAQAGGGLTASAYA